MKNKVLMGAFCIIILLAFFACDSGGGSNDGGTNPGDALVGVWELTSVTDTEGTMNFPIDYATEFSTADIDEDGTDETLTFAMYGEFSQTTARMYGKVTLVDQGTSTIAQWLTANSMTIANIGLPFLENGIKYNPDMDSTITVTATEIVGLGDAGETASYTLEGTTLTLTIVDDNDTPDDDTDDTTMVMVWTKTDSSAIAGAVSDNTISFFE